MQVRRERVKKETAGASHPASCHLLICGEVCLPVSPQIDTAQ